MASLIYEGTGAGGKGVRKKENISYCIFPLRRDFTCYLPRPRIPCTSIEISPLYIEIFCLWQEGARMNIFMSPWNHL